MTTIVKLSQPIEWGGVLVHEIELRPPTAGNYFACGGEPYSIVRTSWGEEQFVPDHDKVRDYIKTLMVHPGGWPLVASLPMRDGVEIAAAVIGFFTGAGRDASPAPATSSSST